MSNTPYIRPLGFISGPPATAAIRAGEALPLGQFGISFSGAEIRTRTADGTVSCTYESARALKDNAVLEQALSRISSPRPAFAGLPIDRPCIMGIVNVTPDSFSDGGKFFDPAVAIDHALKLADEGADILDIGGESTRPGAAFVEIEQELSRVIPVIETLRAKTSAKISIDTRKSDVMRRAADAGADIINDVSALSFDAASAEIAAQTRLPVILMHAQGTPQTMQDNPTYDDVLLDVYDYLAERIEAAEKAGILNANIMTDPGIGFGKDLHHNLQLLAGISIFHGLGCPILLGVSRKRVLGQLADEPDAEKRMPGSIAAAVSAIAQGVQIVRVHDVSETRQAIGAWRASTAGIG